MKICPRCERTYENPAVEFCANDGARLVSLEAKEADQLVGKIVAGKYEVVDVLGTGGMGTVYRAVQQPIDRVVALKVLRKELTDDRVAVRRFKREAKTTGLLRNPHSITIYEAGEEGDILYIAMEFLEGVPLSKYVESRGTLPWTEALELARQICESLAEAHAKGIVHRDLKPENIFLIEESSPGAAREETKDEAASEEPRGKEKWGAETRRKMVKVLDFGIATLTLSEEGTPQNDTITRTGAIVGTPAYMSPEQARGQKADARSDLYSLGCIIYHMLTGGPPFYASEPILLMGKHITAEVSPLSEYVEPGTIPDEVESVVMKLLAKDPKDRYQSAGELIQVFRELLERGNQATPSGARWGSSPRRRPPRPRDRRGLLLVGILMTIGAGVLTGVLVFLHPFSSSTPTAASLASSVSRNRGARPGEAGTDRSEEGVGETDAAAPAEVSLQIRARPAQARISIDGVPLEDNPWSATVPSSTDEHRIRVTAEGYEPRELTVRYDRDRSLVVVLQPTAERGGSSRPVPPTGAVGGATRREARTSRDRPRAKTRGAAKVVSGRAGGSASPSHSEQPSNTGKNRQGAPRVLDLELDTRFPGGL